MHASQGFIGHAITTQYQGQSPSTVYWSNSPKRHRVYTPNVHSFAIPGFELHKLRYDDFHIKLMPALEITAEILRIVKCHNSWSRAHLAVSTEWVLSQTNENCLCESSSPFTMGLYGSPYDYLILIVLIACGCHTLYNNIINHCFLVCVANY